ncbi:beta-ketoacyl- thiolase [Nannochloropsis gaditana]|uniref:Beta-ketoacyl-thiolase n=1 Tax=Nannochloropsis gaditana TaxID=72520 RepID=W7SYP3_9STRA|nr:beta-ketoacyl- thiolase [Nannochloropsis gaditana]
MKKGPLGVFKHLAKLNFKDLGLETPAIANYTTGEVMGHSSDRLSAKFGVSRREQEGPGGAGVITHHTSLWMFLASS